MFRMKFCLSKLIASVQYFQATVPLRATVPYRQFWVQQMGCNVSSDGTFQPEKCDHLWKQMEQTNQKGHRQSHKTWKVMRINVISTHKDFRNERAAIHALLENHEIIEAARSKRVLIMLEDFNSEHKASYEDPESVALLTHCLEESKMDNGSPYYIHLLGECTGYIIHEDFPDDDILNRFGMSRGLSLNEAALIQANIKNPNALFLRRDNSFLREIPFYEPTFIEDDAGRERANYFADRIQSHSNPAQFMIYNCGTEGINNPHHKNVVLTRLDAMQDRVKQFILSHLEKDFRPSGDGRVGAEEARMKMISDRKMSEEQEAAFSKVDHSLSGADIVIVQGDYGTGKTTILQKVSQKRTIPYFECSSLDHVSRAIDSNRGREICLDDIDNLRKNDLISVLGRGVEMRTKLIVSMRKSAKFLKKSNSDWNVDTVQIKTMERKDAKNYLCRYMTFVSPREDVKPQWNFNSDTMHMANQLLDAGSVKDENSVEEGREEPSWSLDKVKILGAMIRSGAAVDKVANMANRSVNSICEADIALMEAETRGHLLVSALSFLALSPSGLREADLRNLLSPEDQLLPHTIRRKYRNLPFEYQLDKYGYRTQVSALRWRFVRVRLAHLMITVDADAHLYQLCNVAKKVVNKRFLSKDEHVAHFRKILDNYRRK